MHPYPHVYSVTAAGEAQGVVNLDAAGLPTIATQPPPQFDGPEGYWSPESLLCAALADCFILTFRSVARISKLEWSQLECRVVGTLERAAGVTRFTRFATHARLVVPPAVDPEVARGLLQRAEHACLVSNSVNGERSLETVIEVQAR